MESIASLVQDDPFLKLSPADRLAQRKSRRDRFWKVQKPAEPPQISVPDLPLPQVKEAWFVIVSDKPAPGAELKIEDILRACCKYFDLTRSQITAARRTAPVVYARQIAMYLCKFYTTKSYPEIGRRLGGRDHTTVLHGHRKVEAAIKKDWLLAYDVAHVEAML